jgi:plastocyanin
MAGTGTVKGTVTGAGRSPAPAADAVVRIEGPSVPAAAGVPHAVVDQKGQKFVPRVLAVPVGTTVDFPNSDPVLHNVNAAFSAEPFDLGLYGQGETKSVTFRVPGVRHLRCNVHPAMEGFVVVHTNPYVAVTDAQGHYTITGVPAGSYEIRVWHESLPERRMPVTVRDGQVIPLDVRLEKER